MRQSSGSIDESLLRTLIQWHAIDMFVGGVGVLINIALLSAFLASLRYLQQNKMLALLAIGDFFTCLGIFVLGYTRRSTYDSVLITHEIPTENSWSCAWKAFVGLRLLGSLIPPAVVLLISAERSLAVFCPVFYRNNFKNSNCKSVLSVLTYTAVSVLTAFCIAYAHRDSPNPVPFYCGRKAAFSAAYSTYVYIADIAGYTIGLLFNSIALCGLYRHYAGREMRSDAQRQLQWLRNLLVISLVSTLTVAIPNMISLRSAWIGRVDIPFSAGAQWMSALKSSINFFVYLSFKPDFRERIAEIAHGKMCVMENKSSGNQRCASGRSCDSKF